MKFLVDLQEVTKNSLYEVNYYDEDENHIGGFGFKASSMDEAQALIIDAAREDGESN